MPRPQRALGEPSPSLFYLHRREGVLTRALGPDALAGTCCVSATPCPRLGRPYAFEFLCNVKARWAGKTLVQLFAEEFPHRGREYYAQVGGALH